MPHGRGVGAVAPQGERSAYPPDVVKPGKLPGYGQSFLLLFHAPGPRRAGLKESRGFFGDRGPPALVLRPGLQRAAASRLTRLTRLACLARLFAALFAEYSQ